MADNMMQRSEWPGGMSSTDPVKQLFDRIFDRHSTQENATSKRETLVHPWVPQADVKEEAHRFIVYVDAPGITSSSIKVHLEHSVLTIKGERKTESQDGRESFLRVERPYGTFHRRLALPASADPRNITVTARDGVLHIVVRKRTDNASRQIWVAKTGRDEPTYADKPFNAPLLMA